MVLKDASLQKLKNYAGQIGDGEIKVGRLNPSEEQGRIAVGRTNVEASLILTSKNRTER